MSTPKVISFKKRTEGYEVPITTIPMNKDRRGKVAKWTSRKKEDVIAVEISEGIRCSHCTKEFTFEEDEEVVIPRPEYSSNTYHKECWDKLPKGQWPDWD